MPVVAAVGSVVGGIASTAGSVAAAVAPAVAVAAPVVKTVMEHKAQSKAEKAQEAALAQRQRETDKNRRITQVQEIKQLTADVISDVNAAEWQEFYSYAIDYPDDPTAVKKKSDEVIARYKDRMKNTGKSVFDTKTETVKSLKDIDMQQEITDLKNKMLGMQIPQPQKSTAGATNLAKYIPIMAIGFIFFIMLNKKGGL